MSRLKALPDPLAREVLDFIGFLRQRGERHQWRDLMNAQARSLAPVWDHSEDSISGTKRRPVLVLTAPDGYGDFIALPVTSHPQSEGGRAAQLIRFAKRNTSEVELGL